jgi:LEA14-like dessication related protein
MGPRVGLDDVEKKKLLTLPGLELRPSVVQPVASLYTDYAINMDCNEIAEKWRIIHNTERHSLYSSLRIVRMIK